MWRSENSKTMEKKVTQRKDHNKWQLPIFSESSDLMRSALTFEKEAYRSLQGGRVKESLAFKPKPKRLPLSSVKLLGLCGTFDILNVFTVWRMWNTFPENWFYKQHLRNFKNICAAVVCTLCACQKFAAHLIYHCAFLVKSCQPMNQQKTCIVSWVQNLLHCPAIPDYSWWMMWLKSTPSLLVTNQSPL